MAELADAPKAVFALITARPAAVDLTNERRFTDDRLKVMFHSPYLQAFQGDYVKL